MTTATTAATTAAITDRPVATRAAMAQGPAREHRVELTLAAVPSAVATTRLLVRRSLATRPHDPLLGRRLVRAAEMLVTHAVDTTGVTDDAPTYADAFDHLQLLVVRLRVFPGRAIVEVWDHGDHQPDTRLPRSLSVAGGEDWGYDLPLPRLRVVWCAVAIEQDHQPARHARRDRHSDALLHRILDGLHRL